MGMFDNFTLPPDVSGLPYSHLLDFQTKDLNCALDIFTIEAGRLHLSKESKTRYHEEVDWESYTGEVEIYTYHRPDTGKEYWIELILTFDGGELKHIKSNFTNPNNADDPLAQLDKSF